MSCQYHRLPLDTEELERSNLLITGTNQQGKSLCAMSICDLLMGQNWKILVFDNVGHWRTKSSVPVYYPVNHATMAYILPRGSMIYDISLLLPVYQKQFVEQVLNDVWSSKIAYPTDQWILVVFEEFQLYGSNTRGQDSQSILRIMSVGANWKIRVLGITPDLSLVDCAFIRLAQQRYHFKLANEPNAKERFKRYYGTDSTYTARFLDVGHCLYVLREESPQIAHIPLFESKIKPIEYNPISERKPESLTEKIGQAFGKKYYKLNEQWEQTQSEIEAEEDEEEEMDGAFIL